MTDPATLVEFRHASYAYGAVPVLEAVDLRVAPGAFVGIVGPSGSGKTTLLRAMLGSMSPVHGTCVRRSGLRVAYVPQVETVDWNFPVTVADVVGMTQLGRRWPRRTSGERAAIAATLERLELSGLADRHIRELSGGQQQRVFLARALIQRPELVVLDEPTSGVDVRTRHEVLHVLADLNEQGMAIVLTTHDLNGFAAHLPRLVCLNRTVVADGPPSEVLHPYVLERTFGAPMEVLSHGGMPVVMDAGMRTIARRFAAPARRDSTDEENVA